MRGLPLSERATPNVAHVVPALFGDDGTFGGAERYVWELARHMARRTPTRLVTFGRRAARERRDGVDVRVVVPWWRVRGNAANPVSPALWRELSGADVVHCHQKHILSTSLTALMRRTLGKKVFVTDYGGGGWDLSAYVSTDRWFDGELHISEYSARLAPAGGAPGTVMLGGVDHEKFSPFPTLPRDRVVFVGRLLPHKGIDVLVEAIPPDLPLEILGRPFDPTYLDKLRSLAAGKKVSFRHDCDDGALSEAYRRAIAVVLPSVYKDCYGHETPVPELLGQTLLEGMACGAPAVTTAVASLPEIVVEGTGFVVPPNDPAALAAALGELSRRPDLVQAFGRAARARVEKHFGWDAVVSRCLAFYSDAAT